MAVSVYLGADFHLNVGGAFGVVFGHVSPRIYFAVDFDRRFLHLDHALSEISPVLVFVLLQPLFRRDSEVYRRVALARV